ncbi:hypothetical protein VOLCADRAFT_96250 [Volvox carteri f. nagariensis]|uniref:Uncharacterized protein n=1 Tax=Volvox carteri f. nagariensis TaxID=3068 RepID=D8U9L9_VOLCA|nr:uncharacterized protein VOLCADRAFT_96250 [Volvox carteri f. nagariensis]EFJ43605.1 hypothetical protein VOLCADRAFT_96250 [Volvox carteri f. nagariensis]|eukprot:XP_002955305.1 hypothetical protein VOLCADRAFT_96250 [Volvox carteri f. nagariensis]
MNGNNEGGGSGSGARWPLHLRGYPVAQPTPADYQDRHRANRNYIQHPPPPQPEPDLLPGQDARPLPWPLLPPYQADPEIQPGRLVTTGAFGVAIPLQELPLQELPLQELPRLPYLQPRHGPMPPPPEPAANAFHPMELWGPVPAVLHRVPPPLPPHMAAAVVPAAVAAVAHVRVPEHNGAMRVSSRNDRSSSGSSQSSTEHEAFLGNSEATEGRLGGAGGSNGRTRASRYKGIEWNPRTGKWDVYLQIPKGGRK